MAEWQTPSADEFNNDWVSPDDQLDDLRGVHSLESTRRRYILDRLKSGVIRAAARVLQIGSAREDLVLISPAYWNSWGDFGEEHFWETGDVTFNIGGADQRFLDVRFNPKWDMTGAGVAIGPRDAVVRPQTNHGGAPRKGWWDDLWIEMIRRIRADTLHPKSGRDLQRIMEEWLAEQEIYPGDDTLKRTANKLFKYLEE